MKEENKSDISKNIIAHNYQVAREDRRQKNQHNCEGEKWSYLKIKTNNDAHYHPQCEFYGHKIKLAHVTGCA